MPHAGHHLPIVDVGVRRTLDAQDPDEAAFEPRQGVINNGVVARHFRFELDNDGTARRDAHSLDALTDRNFSDGPQADIPSASRRTVTPCFIGIEACRPLD
jgi:hypothetical protein